MGKRRQPSFVLAWDDFKDLNPDWSLLEKQAFVQGWNQAIKRLCLREEDCEL